MINIDFFPLFYISGPLPQFHLGDNPFFCDCEMEWLQRVNQVAALGNQHRANPAGHRNQYPRVMDLEDVQCTLNNNNGGKQRLVPIMQVRKQEFLCRYEAHCFALCMCCDFFACDCRMQCPKGCTCYHDSTWSANVIECSGRDHTDVPALIPMDATSLHLDGNNFTAGATLVSQAFIGRKRVSSLYLNNSMITVISNQTFNGLSELEVLHLEDNLIQEVNGHDFENLTALRELHMQRNEIAYIADTAFSSLHSLEVLQLHGNLLVSFPIAQLNGLQLLSSVSMADNPFACQCQFVQDFAKFVQTSSVRLHRGVIKTTSLPGGSVIYDLSDVTCLSQDHSRLQLNGNVTCSDAVTQISYTADTAGSSTNRLIPVAVAIVAVCVVLAVTTVTLFVFRTPLRVWLHSKYGVRLGCCGSSCRRRIKSVSGSGSGLSGDGRLYDAFLGYSGEDEEFVHQILVPALEGTSAASGCEPGFGYKICLQHRDLPSNSSIADTFPGVSQLCSKQILVVSRSYLEHEWTQIKYALKDVKKKWKFVIVMIEELTTLDLAAAPEFNLLLKTATILKWGEAGFWNKIKFYLPDKRHGSRGLMGADTLRIQHQPPSASPTSSGSAMITTSPKSLLTETTSGMCLIIICPSI